MRTVLFFFFLIGLSMTGLAQSPEGNWVITTSTPEGEEVSWKVNFKSNSTYAVDIDLDGSIEITGKYFIDGSTITVQNDPECGCCNDKGIYKFGLKDGKLWMDPVSDPCELRNPSQKVFFRKAGK